MMSPYFTQAYEHYTQRVRVAGLFGYRLWTADFLPQLEKQATQTVRRAACESTLPGVTPTTALPGIKFVRQ